MACYYPFKLQNDKNGTYENPYMHFPCGKCPECVKRRKAQWGFRIEKEKEMHETAYFVTLTYASPPMTPNGFMTLDKGPKSDLTKYFKRLRKAHAKVSQHPIRYYAVGEYGGKYNRPHYHAIIFGTTPEIISESWTNYHDYLHDDGRKCGSVHVGSLTGASANYTVGYIQSKQWRPIHKNDDRIPEFSVMSKGLGLNWLTDEIKRVYYDNHKKHYIFTPGGFKMAIPRYYKNKIWPIEPTAKEIQILHEHPSYITWFQDNERIRLLRQEQMKKILELVPKEERTTREIYEARKQAINMYAQHHKKFRQQF